MIKSCVLILLLIVIGFLVLGNTQAFVKRKKSISGREEAAKRYFSEFCSPGLLEDPKFGPAIRDVFMRIPYAAFLNVTDRQRPVIITEFYDSGTARFASSTEIIPEENDPVCCTKGMTILKLGMALGIAKTPDPIKSVIAHELAHRVLDHIKKGNVNCNAEREANRLIKRWGFGKEFEEASKIFGQRKGDPAGCQEAKPQQKF